MKKLLVIVGPTGTNKTDLAIRLAKKFDGEIVSADSRQLYIGMDIGTGKFPANVKLIRREGFWVVGGVPVYLYDLITPDKTFSVAEYQQLAYKRIHEIQVRDKLPILVGGSGLYIRAVVQGLKVPQVEPDKRIRAKLDKKSLNSLLQELEQVDPKIYLKIDKYNKRRVIRALEVYYKTGKPISSIAKKYKPDFETLSIGLTADREYLYKKVDDRIDSWFEQGFVDEVESLLKKYKSTLSSMTSLGYRQVAAYLDKRISKEEAIKRIKFDHHGYIRRQLTWFKKEPAVIWFDIINPKYNKKIFVNVEKWKRE